MLKADEYMGLAITALTLLAFVAAWWRWVRPRYNAAKGEAVGVRDAILGRPAVLDSITGREHSPALPGIGQRIATVEDAVLQLADQRRELNDHSDLLVDHHARITALEDSRVERVVNQAESLAMWTAVNDTQTDEPT